MDRRSRIRAAPYFTYSGINVDTVHHYKAHISQLIDAITQSSAVGDFDQAIHLYSVAARKWNELNRAIKYLSRGRSVFGLQYARLVNQLGIALDYSIRDVIDLGTASFVPEDD